MRILAFAAAAVLGAAMFLAPSPAEVRADAPGGADPVLEAAAVSRPVPAQPGTEAEEASYALREAESPEAGEFVGGHCGFALLVVLAAAVVLLVLLLQKEGKV